MVCVQESYSSPPTPQTHIISFNCWEINKLKEPTYLKIHLFFPPQNMVQWRQWDHFWIGFRKAYRRNALYLRTFKVWATPIFKSHYVLEVYQNIRNFFLGNPFPLSRKFFLQQSNWVICNNFVISEDTWTSWKH